MKCDIHFTTCHHTTVKCRERTNDYNIEGWNITAWTSLEKLAIAQYSLVSLLEFAQHPVSVIDDGSNIPQARTWLDGLDTSIINKCLYSKGGSSKALNQYFATIPTDTDLICHFEDDHVYFNPEQLDWKNIAFNFLKNNPHIGVVTFKSGLPNRPEFPDYKGAWGPCGFLEGEVPAILYKALGNAHHIMLYETYKKFFPLYGNAGSCETFMNGKLAQFGLLNAELQIPVYAFHSHCFERALPENVTAKELNMSPRGREYGIKNMYEHIKSRSPITYEYYISPQQEIIKEWP